MTHPEIRPPEIRILDAVNRRFQLVDVARFLQQLQKAVSYELVSAVSKARRIHTERMARLRQAIFNESEDDA